MTLHALGSPSDDSPCHLDRVCPQRSKRDAAMASAMEQQQEAQILPMMAKAAVAGGGVEYDK